MIWKCISIGNFQTNSTTSIFVFNKSNRLLPAPINAEKCEKPKFSATKKGRIRSESLLSNKDWVAQNYFFFWIDRVHSHCKTKFNNIDTKGLFVGVRSSLPGLHCRIRKCMSLVTRHTRLVIAGHSQPAPVCWVGMTRRISIAPSMPVFSCLLAMHLVEIKLLPSLFLADEIEWSRNPNLV